MNYPDRRMLWLKMLYLQLYKESLADHSSSIGHDGLIRVWINKKKRVNEFPPESCKVKFHKGVSHAFPVGPSVVLTSFDVDTPLPLQLVGPRPYDALSSFGGKMDTWRGFGMHLSEWIDGGGEFIYIPLC